MIQIQLKHLRFFAFHGIYPEEKTAGGDFEVNASVFFRETQTIASLEQTMNYEMLFEIIRDAMQTPKELLETVAMDIIEKIKSRFPQVQKISIEIIKLNPPITHFNGQVSVTVSKEY
ncbi:MAG: dihydroneopterin aldolase [Chitinophagaceae bacterium]|nr:dihydroneopterin aldolase [Chitinophagaceae bacterium]